MHVRCVQPIAMISCRVAHLEARCVQRGYTLGEVQPCIVSQDGDQIVVDVDHPAYPRTPRPGYEPPLAQSSGCVAGTELKRLIAGFPLYISTTDSCPCNARAAEMDRQGCDWCEENLETIVGWLREQAQARGLPFLDAAGRMLVRRAIKLARKYATRQAGSSPSPAQ